MSFQCEYFTTTNYFCSLEFNRLYRTGDFGSIKADRIVYYEGRKDSQIKIRGHRIDLSEVEQHVLCIKSVKNGIVLCYSADESYQIMIAFVELVESCRAIHCHQIENILRDKLPNYMVPQVVVVDEMPLLVNGKVDRQKLLKIYENSNNNGKTSQCHFIKSFIHKYHCDFMCTCFCFLRFK